MAKSALKPSRRRAPARAAATVDPAAAPTSTEDDRFFRDIVSSIRSGVIAIHRDGRLALMNDEAYRIFALERRPDDVGRPFAEVCGERRDLVGLLSGAFEVAPLPSRVELRLAGLERVIGHTLSQVKDADDCVIGAVLFFKDLTAVEQVKERERLRDRLTTLGQMATGIGHELKNPLAAIGVMAGLLRRQVEQSVDAQSLLADLISEAKLANTIVAEMLEFVRPLRLQLRKTDLSAVFQQAIALAESKDACGECEVRLSLPPDLPVIDGDHQQLCQIFANLLTNAFEALEGKGHVDFTVQMLTACDRAAAAPSLAPSVSVIVDVTDHGPGVPDHLIDRIFDPFFTTKPQGSGLGLSIVRKIVEAHEGRIDLTVIPNGGSRFRVTLPVSDLPDRYRSSASA